MLNDASVHLLLLHDYVGHASELIASWDMVPAMFDILGEFHLLQTVLGRPFTLLRYWGCAGAVATAAVALSQAWKTATLASLLCTWVVPAALVAAFAARVFPRVALQLSRAFQVLWMYNQPYRMIDSMKSYGIIDTIKPVTS